MNDTEKVYVEGTDSNFDKEVLENDVPVLVDFWAPWCAPCRIVGPVVEDLARDYTGRIKLVKLNVDENPQIAMRYGIRSIPTLAVFHGGEPVTGVIGAAPKEQLKDMVDKVVSPVN
ncbi:MAG: thioredoxin [Deltaproteobacteria bacterium]|nr:thioredoxin [Deltaproteobacteria bacterium]